MDFDGQLKFSATMSHLSRLVVCFESLLRFSHMSGTVAEVTERHLALEGAPSVEGEMSFGVNACHPKCKGESESAPEAP